MPEVSDTGVNWKDLTKYYFKGKLYNRKALARSLARAQGAEYL